jgi:hypothetical protein
MWRGPQRPPCGPAPKSIQGAGEVKLWYMGNLLFVMVKRSVAIYRRHVACVLTTLLVLLVPRAAEAAPGGLADCALAGRAADRATVERLMAGQVRRFAGGDVARRTYAAGLAAYVYGLPPVMLHRTVETFPRNQLISIAKLADETTDSIVAPNQDTLYSVAWIDLTAGPLVLETPPTADRYAVVQLLDAFTNAAAYVGDGERGARGERVALVPPGFNGAVPAGVRRIRMPTNTAWLLGRTLVDPGAADLAVARALLGRYRLTPLADWTGGARTAPLILDDFPADRRPVRPPAGLGFFDALGADLAKDRPPARDACALRAFRAAGIGPGLAPGRQTTGARRRALQAAAADGPRLVDRLVAATQAATRRAGGGWTVAPGNIARFGRDYPTRAFVTEIGLGANTAEKALYPNTSVDSRGRRLHGRHVYELRFAPGRTPPVRAFWSLTLYDRQLLFYDNPLDRYALGDRSPGLRRDRDGGLTIRVSHDPPPAARRANWLPAPDGRFSLYLRLYEPRAAAVSGSWRPPAVRRVR